MNRGLKLYPLQAVASKCPVLRPSGRVEKMTTGLKKELYEPGAWERTEDVGDLQAEAPERLEKQHSVWSVAKTFVLYIYAYFSIQSI